MTVGLYIPPELLTAGLSPAEILIAAEILQFGDGKCYASSNHFSARLSMPKRTVFRALKTMKESGVLTFVKGVKVINIEISESAKVALNDAEMALTGSAKMAANRAKSDMPTAKLAASVPKWQQNIEVNIEDKQETNMKRAAAPAHSPEVISLAETMAKIRREVSGLVKASKQPVEYYSALFAKMLDGEATLDTLTIVVNWLDSTPEGRKAFGFGMANMPKTHKHSFEQFFATNLAKARAAVPSKQAQPAAWPGTDADRRNPAFCPGPGWKLSTTKTVKVSPLDLSEIVTEHHEWIPAEGNA